MHGARTPVEVKCPTCGATVVWSESASWRPFCSDRCRMIDLGAWFTEERAIPETAGQDETTMSRPVKPSDRGEE